MGIVVTKVTFEEQTPSLLQMCKEVESICSLPVVLLKSEIDKYDDDLYATIAFECDQGTFFDVTVSHKENTTEFRLRGYLGQELTLMGVTKLALEKLGGVSTHPMQDSERNEYSKPINELELKKRHHHTARQNQKLAITMILMLPILIPVWIMRSLWFTLKMPYYIWQAFGELEEGMDIDDIFQ